MNKYRLLSHTADIGLDARGEDLAEAFARAGEGLFSIITDRRTVRARTSREFSLAAPDPESLLFEWLNRLIYVFDTELFLFSKFEVEHYDGHALKALGFGEHYDAARHHLRTEVKSATFHQMRIDDERCEVRVYFDV